MRSFRRALLAVVAFFSCALPAAAQTTVPAAVEQGPSLLWVWVWILVAGIIIFIIGTSAGLGSGRR